MVFFLLPVNRTSLEGTGENGVNNGYELCSVLAPLHGMERQKEREGGRREREGEGEGGRERRESVGDINGRDQ